MGLTQQQREWGRQGGGGQEIFLLEADMEEKCGELKRNLRRPARESRSNPN
jgi:hypothetical protein